MAKLHENINLDMLIDRIVNRSGGGGAENLENVIEKVECVICHNGVFPALSVRDYVQKRFIKYAENEVIIDELSKIPVIEQKSDEWHRVRQTIVTASDFAQALNEGKFGTQIDFLHKKSGYKDIPFDNNCPPLKWGVMFEDVASALYERRNSAKVIPFGLIKHPSVAHFGASPDGITTLGVMVEIKCPYRRKITNEVPKQYYYQIQGQLDVCGLDECDFLECEFKKVSTVDDLKGMCELCEIGCIVETLKDEVTGFKYSDIFTSDETGINKLSSWIDMMQASTANIFAIHIWYLEFTNTIRVYKDPDFIDRKMSALKDVWNRVEMYRQDKDLYDTEIGDKSEKNVRKAEKAAAAPPKASTASKAKSYAGSSVLQLPECCFLED